MTKGFKIGDRLLRATQVGVSSNNDNCASNADDEKSDEKSAGIGTQEDQGKNPS